jgi:hypothetical protein
VNITVAALPRSGTAASRRPPVITQKVSQASGWLQRGRSRARAATKGRKPQMKKVVKTRTFRTPWIVRPW